MEDHERAREAFESEEAYALHCLRHSAAHVMAQAVMYLWPQASLAIGPAIDDGFYYDIGLDETISEEDLPRIESRMRKIVKQNQAFIHEEWTKDEARAFFGEHGQGYKLELIDGIADEKVSIYKNPSRGGTEFVDLCAGPHVKQTRDCKFFKLLKVSGAYWRADANNDQLQRIYGTVWPTKEELDQYLYRLAEAKKRDHRKVGRDLDLPSKEIPKEMFGSPLSISENIGEGYDGYVVALWGGKEAPCHVERHGCREFGFVLADPRVSVPPFAYSSLNGATLFAPLETKLTIHIMNSGTTRDRLIDVKKAMEKVAKDYDDAFPEGNEVVEMGKTTKGHTHIEVRYRDVSGADTATAFAASIKSAVSGTEVKTAHWAEAPAAFVIEVGGGAPTAAKGKESAAAKPELKVGERGSGGRGAAGRGTAGSSGSSGTSRPSGTSGTKPSSSGKKMTRPR